MSGQNQQQSSGLMSSDYLDERMFKFKVMMWNDDGRIVKIPRGTIKELVIHEDIYDWYHSGHMVISNPRNVLERASKRYVNEQEIEMLPYRFRNDGRDYLYIEIDPPVQDDPQSDESLDNEVYTIRLLMSIYDTQDVSSENMNNKTKKISFWDYRHHLMMETNMWWSTSYAVNRQSTAETYNSLYLTKDSSRTVYTGQAIKDLITECLKSETTQPEFEDDFSKGGEKLHYTSPAAARAVDDLAYLMEHHVHDIQSAEPCILRINRHTDKWSLLPISEIFHRATDGADGPGDMQLDRFYIADESMDTDVSTNQLRTPKKAYAMNNMFTDYNMINNFEFLEQSAQLNAELINTTLVHMYDSGKKQFNIHMEQSDIAQVRDYMKKNVLDKLLGGEGGPASSIVLNQTFLENKNVKHLFSPVATMVRDNMIGRNRTIMANILSGNTIVFNVKGFTSRNSGKFISIDRDLGYDDNDFDDKILGQYLVTSVDHVIDTNGYHNQVIATKPYLYKDQQFNENVL